MHSAEVDFQETFDAIPEAEWPDAISLLHIGIRGYIDNYPIAKKYDFGRVLYFKSKCIMSFVSTLHMTYWGREGKAKFSSKVSLV